MRLPREKSIASRVEAPAVGLLHEIFLSQPIPFSPLQQWLRGLPERGRGYVAVDRPGNDLKCLRVAEFLSYYRLAEDFVHGRMRLEAFRADRWVANLKVLWA